ncbi:ACP phosphodiesterase [Flavobacterium sp. I3-2]|uniref:acyl carrier protein phosphodiesterase n=1 Tax=Flavobacterium sp. I3-2 TaxID=2748319 RepID=UPI0015B1EF3C|nr:ACP phosphodiesterase [Flavobacterium sp. I3-2]
MNFLAHIYLSGNNERIKIGNFMGDGVRGKDYNNFHLDIKIGILLHREIDTFTDNHEIFRKSKRRFSAKYNHFSGIITDMIYDHFLSKNWNHYSDVALKDFAHNFYESLRKHYDELNDKTKYLLPYISERDWLYNYQFLEELQIILGQMDKRFKFDSNMKDSIFELQQDYDLFENEFTLFFNELIQFSDLKRKELENTFSV